MKNTIIISLAALSLAATAYAGTNITQTEKNMRPNVGKQETTVKNNMINSREQTKTKVSSEMDIAKKPYARNKSQIEIGKDKTKKDMNKRNPDMNNIKGLQTSLKNNGYKVSVDGYMGQETTKAIKKYQKDNNMKATGKLDSKTRTALMGNSEGSSNEDY